MAENVATVVDWYGPFVGKDQHDMLAAARSAAREKFGKGLYAAVGRTKAVRRGPKALLYVGVGSPFIHKRLVPAHHVLGKISFAQLWIGEVGVAAIPGKRRKRIDPHLDIVEWTLAYFMQCEHNDRKRSNPPPNSCLVLNRWWKGENYEEEAVRSTTRWPDLIEYDSWRGTANCVWFGSRPRVKAIRV